RMKGQFGPGLPLRVLAVYATKQELWIGTGYGEWGGHLLGLDPKTGDWVQYHDEHHYATSITQMSADEVVVSWSMSHFDADTLIRRHELDSNPSFSFPELDSRYYQIIAYSAFDETLYGVENTDVVTISNGRPTKIAKLTGQLFEREARAIGVAPGI